MEVSTSVPRIKLAVTNWAGSWSSSPQLLPWRCATSCKSPHPVSLAHRRSSSSHRLFRYALTAGNHGIPRTMAAAKLSTPRPLSFTLFENLRPPQRRTLGNDAVPSNRASLGAVAGILYQENWPQLALPVWRAQFITSTLKISLGSGTTTSSTAAAGKFRQINRLGRRLGDRARRSEAARASRESKAWQHEKNKASRWPMAVSSALIGRWIFKEPTPPSWPGTQAAASGHQATWCWTNSSGQGLHASRPGSPVPVVQCKASPLIPVARPPSPAETSGRFAIPCSNQRYSVGSWQPCWPPEQLSWPRRISTATASSRSPDTPASSKTRIIARQHQVVRVDREETVSVRSQRPSMPPVRASRELPQGSGWRDFRGLRQGFLTQAFVSRASRTRRRRPEKSSPRTPIRATRSSAAPKMYHPQAQAARQALRHGWQIPTMGPAENPAGRWSTCSRWAPPSSLEFQIPLPPHHPERARHDRSSIEPGRPTITPHPRQGGLRRFRARATPPLPSYTSPLCAGATFPEAAEISNHASRVVVSKLGTATLTPEELLASFDQKPTHLRPESAPSRGRDKQSSESGSRAEARRAVFFDRDGTRMREEDHCDHPSRVRRAILAPAEALAELRERGRSQRSSITNQSGIGRVTSPWPTMRRWTPSSSVIHKCSGSNGCY